MSKKNGTRRATGRRTDMLSTPQAADSVLPISSRPRGGYELPTGGESSGMPSYERQMSQVTMRLSDLTRPYGDSGTRRWGGFFFEEYNPDWEARERVDIVEEMRRGDGACKAALAALQKPILAATWDVQAGSEDDEDKEIAEWVKERLFGMRRTWKEFLREALKYQDFGHYVFELIWGIRDGRPAVIDLEPRIPHSILRWRTEDGKFGIQQLLQTDEADGLHGIASVPAEKLLILTNEKEGDDVTGQSVLRAAYKHWNMKQTLYKIQAIAAERFGAGTPVIKPAGTASEADKKKAEEWGRNMRTNEQSYIVLPTNEWEVSILVPEGRGAINQTIEAGIEHHNTQILLSTLATFLGLGSGGKGSYALSSDLTSFFIKNEDDAASYFAEQIDRQIIKKMVDLAWGPREKYPKLTHGPIGDIDQAVLSQAISVLADAGLVKPDAELKQWTRSAFGMPKLSPEAVEAEREADLETRLRSLEMGAAQPDDAPAEDDAAGDEADAKVKKAAQEPAARERK